MKIGLVTVFRDEEDWIAGMLQSTLGMVDAVYALANGSVDRSHTIVSNFCVRHGLHHVLTSEPEACGWPDHLYNRVLDQAQADGCDWILLLDADERLTGHARKSLRVMAETGATEAYALSRRTVIAPYCPTAGGDVSPWTDSLEFNENHYRFFKPGTVRYPEGSCSPHQGAVLQVDHAVWTENIPTYITHERDGWEQLRRDKLRGQYPDTPLPPLHETIPGWFDFQNAYDLMVAEARDGGVLVELGNYLGRSLVYLGHKAQQSGKALRIYGVDTYRQDPVPYHHVEVMAVGTRWLPVIAQNVHRAGLGDTVNLLQCLSWDAARLFDDGAVDGVWVDAAHDGPSVARDIAAWWPRLRSGGYMGGHDYSSAFPDLMAVVDAWAESEGLLLDITTSPASWLVRKP